ncbi:hypothetical protein V8059_004508 [Vibrio parahaemolyticus]
MAVGKTVKNVSISDIKSIKDNLSYNPTTGEISWKKRGRGRKNKPGTIVNNKVVIKLKDSYYTSAELAWVIMTGIYPFFHITYRDGNSLNTAWHNLKRGNHKNVNSGKRSQYTDEHIKQVYEEKGLSNMAEHFNVKYTTASRWLREIGVPITKEEEKKKGKRNQYSDDYIKQVYAETEHLPSIAEQISSIAERFDITTRTAYRWLDDLGIHTNENKRSQYSDEYIKQVYAETSDLSSMAEHFNVSYGTISRWLRELEVSVKKGKKRAHSDDYIKQVYAETEYLPSTAERISSMAERLDITTRTAYKWLDDLGIDTESPYSDEYINDVKTVYKNTGSMERTAEHFSVSISKISRLLHKLGVTINTPGGSYHARHILTEVPGVTKINNNYQVKMSGIILTRTPDFFEACCIRKSAENKKA